MGLYNTIDQILADAANKAMSSSMTTPEVFMVGVELGNCLDRLRLLRLNREEWEKLIVSPRNLETVLALIAAYGFEVKSSSVVGQKIASGEPTDYMVHIHNVNWNAVNSPTVRDEICDMLKAFGVPPDYKEATKLHLTTEKWDSLCESEEWNPEEIAEHRARGTLVGVPVVFDAPEFKLE